MKTLHTINLILIILTASICLQGQEKSVDILDETEKLKKRLEGNAFQYGGSINMDFRFNNIIGIDRRTDPFNMRINGSTYFSLYGVRTAININYSDGRVVHRLNRPNIKLPAYAFLGMSPTYKWAKLHIGYRSMQFSPYTMSGNNFYGAGLELSPGKFRLGGFYGRLQRARPENLDALSSVDPSYKRIGWGVKTGYTNKGDEIYLIVFSAKDDPNSIEQPILRNDVLPAENTVLSLTGKKKISEIISLDIDYAWSAFTRDNRSEKIENLENSFIRKMGGLYIPKISSGYHKALNTGINFNFSKLKIDLRHERVDPGYQSLGALFFNNDYERITTGASRSFLSNRLNVNGRLGYQKNNLSGLESNTLRRIVANISTAIKANDRLSFTATYSNFSNTAERSVAQVPIIEIDSIALTQVNRNIQVGANYIAGKSKRSIFNSFISYQVFNSITNDVVDTDRNVENIIGNFSHSYRLLENKGTIGNSVVINHNNTSFTEVLTIIPSHSYGRTFLDKKLKAQIGFSNAFLLQDNEFSRYIFQVRIRSDYKVTDKATIGIQGNFTKQSMGQVIVGNNFTETGLRIRAKLGF